MTEPRQVRVDSELSVRVDVVIEMALGRLSELVHADDLVLMSKTIKRFRNKFIKWKEAYENNHLTVKVRQIKVMVSESITKFALSKSEVYLICSLRERERHQCLKCGSIPMLLKSKKSNAESPSDGKHSEELVQFSRTKKSQPASNVRFTTNASFRQSPTDLKRGI